MTARDQAREAEELERMLQSGGTTAQPTAEVQPTSEPSSSRPEQVAPAPAPKEKDTPAPKAETKEAPDADPHARSEEHTSELQSLMRSSYAVFCLKKKKNILHNKEQNTHETLNVTKTMLTPYINI